MRQKPGQFATDSPNFATILGRRTDATSEPSAPRAGANTAVSLSRTAKNQREVQGKSRTSLPKPHH
jgi:hypothetical protein